MRKFLLACTLGFDLPLNWVRRVPETELGDSRGREAAQKSIAPSPAALNAAKQVYADQCANCHGDTGKGDGSDAMMYDPGPADLTDASRMNKLTDGEIYYQITQGRKPMPSFKKRLTEEQRWQLVLLVRSFASAPAKH